MSELQSQSSGTVWPLGRYLVLAELGRGGMAEVYLALARGPNGFNKLVVLKLLRSHLAEDDDFLEMFLAEARLAARLNHPNVVQTYEVGVEGGRHCIVMEYLEGRSLSEIELATHLAIPAMLAVRILSDALGGLHCAHELADIDGRRLELVHRDISPHNLFVTYDGQVKVLDFGIAKAANNGALTKTGVFKGKVRYTAPERFAGEDTDRRSDIFSFGVVLWQALAGARLWAGLNDMGIMHQLSTRGLIPKPSTVNPTISPRLEAICMKALAYEPKDRFARASEMQDALEEILATESVGTTNRALSKFMGELFGPARAQFQRTVEEQLRIAATLPLELTPSFSRLRVDAVPVMGHAPSSGSLSVSSGLASALSVPRRTSARPPLLSSMAPATRTAAPPDAGPRRPWSVVALFTLVTLIAAGAIVTHRGPSSSDAPADRAAASHAPPAVDSIAPIAAHSVSPVASAAPSAPAKDESALDASVQEAKRPPAASALVAPPPPPSSPRSKSAPREPRTSNPSPQPEPAKPDCSSPYFVDDEGTKKIKPECL